MKFSELQQQLKEKFDIDHLADIARELGVSPQTVSNWKARDRVPYKYVIEIRNRLKNDNSLNDNQKQNKTAENQNLLTMSTYSHYSEKDTFSLMDMLLIIAKHLKVIIMIPTIFCIYMITN